MIRTINQAVKFLEGFIPPASKIHPGELGLKRMEKLVGFLGNPQLNYPTVHVGGTSGKGSTATIIASILATRYKVGLHTSPHLVRINERIQITNNNKQKIADAMSEDISDYDFISLVNEIRPSIQMIKKGRHGAPSYFEIVTAMAFYYFAQKKIDIAVIEVGMGGRFDATNVLNPSVAVLTNVGLDHTEVLGETVEKIATDKAGIIKPGIQVITGVRQPSVREIFELKAKSTVVQAQGGQDSRISLLNKDFKYKIRKLSDRRSYFDYFGKKNFKNLNISLLGAHQVENATLAIRAVECFKATMKQSNNETISEEDIRKGLQSAYIPGRLEIINQKPLVILDGAHNPDKMRALVSAIKSIWPDKKVMGIVAIKQDKNAREMLKILFPVCKKIIFTSYEVKMDQGNIISYSPEKLGNIAKKINRAVKIQVVNNPKVALVSSIRSASKDDMILVTGSLYLVGGIKKFLISN